MTAEDFNDDDMCMMQNTAAKSCAALLLVLMFANATHAGVIPCRTISSGLWSNPSIWDCGNSPGPSNAVVIATDHTVMLDVNASVNSIMVDIGGDLDVASTASGLVLSLGGSDSDLSNASIHLSGNLTIQVIAPFQPDIRLGSIDGAFSLELNSDGPIRFSQAIGNELSLSSVTLGMNGTAHLQSTITTTGLQTYSGPVLLENDIVLTTERATFNSTVSSNSQTQAFNLRIEGSVSFNNDVVPDASSTGQKPVGDLEVSGDAVISVPNGALITTERSQRYLAHVILFSDAIFTSLLGQNEGTIEFNALSGSHHATVNTSGLTVFQGNIGAPALLSITTDAAGATEFRNAINIELDSSVSTTFFDDVFLGNAGDVTITQSGSGNIVFDQSVSINGTSPHSLTINDVSGNTVFNGTVLLGQLITNDGAGDDKTIFRGGTVFTTQFDENPGTMVFNDPVDVMSDIKFAEFNDGSITFNNAINQATGTKGSQLVLESDSVITLGPVGQLNPVDSIETQGGPGIVASSGSLHATSLVLLDSDFRIGSDLMVLTEEFAAYRTTNLQSNTLTIDAEFSEYHEAIVGTGDLVHRNGSLVFLDDQNTYSGKTILISSDLSLQNNDVNNSLRFSQEILLDENSFVFPNFSTNLLELSSGQTISGTGYVFGGLLAAKGSIIKPGSDLGILNIFDLKMNSGSILSLQINGPVPSDDHDQLVLEDVDLDADQSGGATLSLSTDGTLLQSQVIRIIDTVTAIPLSGTFQSLPEGSTVIADDGTRFRISYRGGDGNDVTLTVLGPTVFVDVDSVGDSGACAPGECWENAHDNLQDAISGSGSDRDIWVANGVYYPDLGNGVLDNDPESRFFLMDGIGLFGGFSGNETTLEQRDLASNRSILSGDLAQDDDNTDGNFIAETVNDISGQNAYHIMDIGDADSAVIDGFTITAGAADGDSMFLHHAGSGLRCSFETGDNIILSNNVWIGNLNSAIFACDALISNSQFISNQGGAGGGAINNGNHIIRNSRFLNNTAESFGGAVRSSCGTSIDQSEFIGNETGMNSPENSGGGAFSGCFAVITNSLFMSNVTNGLGGAVYGIGNLTLNNVTMTGNRSHSMGGAVHSEPLLGEGPAGTTSVTIRNSVIWNNQDASGIGTLTAGVNRNGRTVTFINSLYQGSAGSSDWNPMAGTDLGGNLDVDPLFLQEVDLLNVPSSQGNAHVSDESPLVNQGENAFVMTQFDLDGRERIQDGIVDIGAYEGIGLLFSDGFEETP